MRRYLSPLIIPLFALTSFLNAFEPAFEEKAPSPFIDLEARQQDFVLQTRRIHVPGYPDAFNPSITRWNDSLLMSFRARDVLTGLTNLILLTWLDENFDPIGNPQILKVYHKYPSGSLIQDPRLIVINDKLMLVYSNIWNLPNKGIRRVYISEIEIEDDRFVAKNPEVILHFDVDPINKFEKNWVPFEYNGDLLLAYSINPHKIFLPIYGTKSCETLALTQGDIHWNWGEIRGGTQALVVGNEYLSFFHSSKLMSTKHSNGEPMIHYFMGAYTFERDPPFAITRMSPDIIVGKNFYNGSVYGTWKPLRVIFPCGFVFDNEFVWITYGRQDNELWIVKLDRNKLLNSLIPVK